MLNIYDRKEIYRLEPFIPLLLSLHGTAILSYFSHPGWKWGGVAVAAGIAIHGLLKKASSASVVIWHAALLAITAATLITTTGMTRSFFSLWCLVIAATYPIIIPIWTGIAIPVALAIYYGFLYFIDPFPMPPLVIMSRCSFMIFMGLITHSFGIGLMRLGEAEHLANTDPLTGIPNRRHFFFKGDKEFQRAQRLDTPLTVILLDCDRFKEINDRYGHKTGDDTLKGIADMLKREVRKIDIPARIGEDEFAIILPGTDEAGARAMAARLNKASANIKICCGNRCISPSLSIGVGGRNPDTTSFKDILDAADRDMYRNKRSKRDEENRG